MEGSTLAAPALFLPSRFLFIASDSLLRCSDLGCSLAVTAQNPAYDTASPKTHRWLRPQPNSSLLFRLGSVLHFLCIFCAKTRTFSGKTFPSGDRCNCEQVTVIRHTLNSHTHILVPGRHLLLLVASVALLACVAADAEDGSRPPEVEISAGSLRGKWTKTRGGRPIAAFEGIPFAQPPEGQLRFQVKSEITGLCRFDIIPMQCLSIRCRFVIFSTTHFSLGILLPGLGLV